MSNVTDTFYSDPFGTTDAASIVDANPDVANVSIADGIKDAAQGTVFSLDYYRDKIAEYQRFLNSIDDTYAALENVRDTVSADPQSYAEWQAFIDELDSKKNSLVLTAQGLNLAIGSARALGADLSDLMVPARLGNPVIIAGIAAAIAAAAALIVWGNTTIQAIANWLEQKTNLQALPEKDRLAYIQALEKTKQAQAQNNQNPVSAVASIIKWVAIAAGVYFGYKAIAPMLKG